jgi:hypothetical protein
LLAHHNDAIIAVATAPGRGAVGIVRVSGKQLAAFAHALCGRVLQPRIATYLPLNDKDAIPIDQVLALYFQGPNSYTGEDVLELQAHGGPVVLQMIVARCFEVATDQLTNQTKNVSHSENQTLPNRRANSSFRLGLGIAVFGHGNLLADLLEGFGVINPTRFSLCLDRTL